MKVLQINSVCGYGSTGRIATDLYKILEEQGHECLIAYGRGAAPKGINSIKIGTDFDNYMHVAKTRLFDLHGFASTKATKEFIKKAKEYNPDVIHLHNIHGYYINIELLFNYLKGVNKPIVWTLHDCWAFTGHCAHFDYIKCNKWENGCSNCPQKGRYPMSSLMDNSKSNYERKKALFNGVKNMTIVTPSKWLAGLVKQSFLKEHEVIVINNGIDLDVFSPKDRNIFRRKYSIEDKFLILGVASIWDARKGFEYLLELSKLINSDSKIVLVGLNNKQLKQLPQNIIGIKRTNNIEELAEIYSAADIYVNPTLEDTFPTTNLEALACGTPVFTFDTGGSVESIDNTCSLVVEKGNIQQLVNEIKQLKKGKFKSCDCEHRGKSYDKYDRYTEYIELFKSL